MAVTKKAKTTRARPRTKARKAKKPPSSICFTIMPFGGWLDDYYLEIYVPAIKAAGLTPHRADDLFRPSTIVNDIWDYTRKARLLLADLTGKNPNVFYELGLAHALAKPAILLAESMDDIPFDLRSLRIIVYDKNAHDWGTTLKAKITAAIREVVSSPTSAVLPAFLNVTAAAASTTVTPQQKELLEIRQELDLLKREVGGEAGSLGMDRRSDIGPTEARRLIAHLLRRGAPADLIVRRVRPLGPPAGWIESGDRDAEEEQEAHVATGARGPTVSGRWPLQPEQRDERPANHALHPTAAPPRTGNGRG